MKQSAKKKEGIARLIELASANKWRMTAACTLSVLSSVCRIVPFFTIYKVLQTMIRCYASGAAFTFESVKGLVLITAVSAVLYGVFAYASAMLSHGAAFDILYELRMKLMEKMGRISSGYYTANTQGAIKKLLIEDVEQIEVFIAHSMCEVAAAIATPLFTIIVLFLVDWRLTLVSLLPIVCSFVILGMALKKPDGAKHQQNMADAKSKMEGTIIEYIHGMPVTHMTQEHLLSKISMVFQDVYLFKDTIAENIRLGRPDASQAEIIAAAKSAACHDFITALPDCYDTMVGEGGSTLSGGEKQRISIARAILSDAPIVFLDEATASLDPENEVLIQRAIDALVQNKTVLVIAHRLQSVMNADQIIVLDDGRIIEKGTHSELLRRGGRYAALWQNQQKAGNWKLA